MDFNDEYWDSRRGPRPVTSLTDFTRSNLLLVGILLGFLDIMAIASLKYDNDLGGFIASLAVVLALTAGAAATFRGVLLWGKPVAIADSEITADQSEQTRRPVGAGDLDVFNVRSNAA
jgi:hypothetical protein